jgi:hypothetical protein
MKRYGNGSKQTLDHKACSDLSDPRCGARGQRSRREQNLQLLKDAVIAETWVYSSKVIGLKGAGIPPTCTLSTQDFNNTLLETAIAVYG